ncbi:hypothetical protein VTH82DRAFT_557 [Thermothelomyces myriococcoides]
MRVLHLLSSDTVEAPKSFTTRTVI